MPGLLRRLLGLAPDRQQRRGPTLAGVDPITQRAIALQKAYWQPAPDELQLLETRADPSWTERLRIHHLRCMAWLDADDARLRRALLAPRAERPQVDGRARDPRPRERVLASASLLLARRSPFRPRHGFAWLGDGAPEADAIPYSDFQGRTMNAALTHLGALEVIALDGELEPAALEFVPFDELMTLALGRCDPDAGPVPFRPARVLAEYGEPERVVLLPMRHGLSWYSYEPEVVRGSGDDAEVCVGSTPIAGLAGRTFGLCVGPQRVETLSDHEHEGLGSFRLADCYQLSLAIDEDDPRFADKCRGRGIDPDATRGDVVRESRLRASARAKRTTLD